MGKFGRKPKVPQGAAGDAPSGAERPAGEVPGVVAGAAGGYGGGGAGGGAGGGVEAGFGSTGHTAADLYRPAYGGGGGVQPGSFGMAAPAYGGGVSVLAPAPTYSFGDPAQQHQQQHQQQQAAMLMMGGGGGAQAYTGDAEQRHMGMGISSILHPDMAGVMLKCRLHNLNARGLGSNWEARYFILKNQVLLCYESDPTKPGADPKKMSKHTVWYNPDEVIIGDAGDGSGPAVILQQLDGDPFLLSAPKGSDQTLVDQWGEALRAVPPELQRALAALADTKAQLMKARRELRNQAIEKQQIDEHLESMTGLQDVEVELTELLHEKQRQMEGYVAQLQRERAERAGLEAELKRSRQKEEELEEQLRTEREKAKQLITQAKKEARKARRLAMHSAERARNGGEGFDAAANAAWLRMTTICRDQGAQIVEILLAFDDRPEMPGTVDYREFAVGLSQLGLDCKAPRLQQLLGRFIEGSGSRRRVAYREAIGAIGAQAAQAAEDIAEADGAASEQSAAARARARAAGVDMRAAAVEADAAAAGVSGAATGATAGSGVSVAVKSVFAELEDFLKLQIQECVDNSDVVVTHAAAKQRVQTIEAQLQAASADLARERERDPQLQAQTSAAGLELWRQVAYLEEQHAAAQAECRACAQQKDRHFGDPGAFQQKPLDVERMLIAGRRKLADATTLADQQTAVLAQTKAGLKQVLEELALKEDELLTAKQRLRRMVQSFVDEVPSADLPSLTIRPSTTTTTTTAAAAAAGTEATATCIIIVVIGLLPTRTQDD
jgi:hypothetical protein